MPDGPKKWADTGGSPLLQEGFWFNGVFISGGRIFPLQRWTRDPGSTLIPTEGQNDVAQSSRLAGDAPLNLAKVSIPFEISVVDEDDYHLFNEAADYGNPVELWPDVLLTDLWYMPGSPTRTTWKTSRRLPWALTGVDHAKRPPKVFIDSTELTVQTASSPAAGFVTVPETGGFGTIETNAADTGTLLKLRYWPVFLVVIRRLDSDYRSENNLRFRMEVEEHRGAVFTVGT